MVLTVQYVASIQHLELQIFHGYPPVTFGQALNDFLKSLAMDPHRKHQPMYKLIIIFIIRTENIILKN